MGRSNMKKAQTRKPCDQDWNSSGNAGQAGAPCEGAEVDEYRHDLSEEELSLLEPSYQQCRDLPLAARVEALANAIGGPVDFEELVAVDAELSERCRGQPVRESPELAGASMLPVRQTRDVQPAESRGLRFSQYPGGMIRPVETGVGALERQRRQTLGVTEEGTAHWLASQLMAVKTESSKAFEAAQTPAAMMNALSCLLDEIGPQDGIEGMMAVQLAAMHQVGMDLLRRAGGGDSMAAEYSKQARSLLDTFRQHVETLDRRRGKTAVSQQRMVVEHITVAGGGQAVIGQMQPSENKKACTKTRGRGSR